MASDIIYGPVSEMYHRFRPLYGNGPYELIRSRAASCEHAVDLGAGTGHVTRELLSIFAHVTAIEPDRDMARLLPNHSQLTTYLTRAEDAILAKATADVVVSGTAFHWMHAGVVSRLVRSWLKPNGFFFVFGIPSARGTLRILPERAREPIRAESLKWEAYKREPVKNWIPYIERISSAEAFTVVEPWQGEIEITWTPVEMAGYFLSSSFAIAYAQNETSNYLELLAERIAVSAGTETIKAHFKLDGAIAHN